MVQKPDLAQALKVADTVVVARVVSGKAHSSTAGASAEIVLRIVRVLQGEITAGTEIAVKTQGSRLCIPGPASKLVRRWVVEPFTALWFLRREAARYVVTPVTAGAGEPECAGLELPEDTPPPASAWKDLHRAVAEEIVATLRVMATKHPREIKPVYNVQVIHGTVDRSYILGRYAAKALSLTEALPTLRDQATLLAINRELASDPAGYLRAIGLAGLIAAGWGRTSAQCHLDS